MAQSLSLLDLSPIESGSTSRQALRNSVELAQLAEQLGFHRVWYAEHHNTVGLASASPELMIAHIANQTSTIRVGSGGVMLPNHSPLRIAEAFRLLEALHPGRIDLGLGRAPGTDTLTAYAMRRAQEALSGDDYPEQLAELIAYDDRSFPGDHPFRSIKPIPADVKLPPLWLLGSSGFSAQLAAQVGLGFSFASHINFAAAVPALRTYRAKFSPSTRFPSPYAILTVSVVIGETEEHARDLALILDLIMLRLRSGKLGHYPTLEEAKAYPFTDAEREALRSMPTRALVGTIDQVHEEMQQLAKQAEADELMVLVSLPSMEDRRRALNQLADAFDLDRGGITPIPDVLTTSAI
jgi:luciferase family oxidoreductase group 1